SLQAAVKRGDPIGKDDVTAYENSFGRANQFSKATVSYKAAEGKTIPSGNDDKAAQQEPMRQVRNTDSSDMSAPAEDSFPSFEASGKSSINDGIGSAASDFSKYKAVVSGRGRLGTRKYGALSRKTVPGVKPRSAAGTGRKL
ncbi:hypothetical protein HKX48_003293, partial [Thoreauomyces humboldtii]